MILLLFCFVILVLLDHEPEYPMFHVQDVGSSYPYPGQGVPYYLCYRYPRPNYWINWLIDRGDKLFLKESKGAGE